MKNVIFIPFHLFTVTRKSLSLIPKIMNTETKFRMQTIEQNGLCDVLSQKQSGKNPRGSGSGTRAKKCWGKVLKSGRNRYVTSLRNGFGGYRYSLRPLLQCD
ncbi:hypothetical protein CsSME_00042649 [Camellia sinensis var. sinensis]